MDMLIPWTVILDTIYHFQHFAGCLEIKTIITVHRSSKHLTLLITPLLRFSTGHPSNFWSPHAVGPATHTIWSFQNTHGEALQDGALRFKWPSKWVSGDIHPISGAITLLITGRGPLCKNHSIEHILESTLDHLFPSWMRNKGLKHRVLVRIPFHVHNESPCEDLEKWTPKWTVSPNLWFFSLADPTKSTRNQERILRFEKNRRHIKISTVAYA